jgi:hypothetical protein
LKIGLLEKYMFSPRNWKFFLWGLLTVIISGIANPVTAQTNGRVILTPPIIDRFPEISFFFDAYNNQSQLIGDLIPEQLEILEDGYAMPFELNRAQPGAQIILALNTASSTSTNSGNSILFDTVRQALVVWGQNQASVSPDDYSLSTNSGIEPAREKNLAKWALALANYQPESTASEPNLVSLTQALDLATDSNPDANMKKAILFITPALSESNLAAFPNLADRASKMGVHIFIWLISSDAASSPQISAPYIDLAQRTDGQLFIFSGTEPLPDPNQYFEPLRFIYHIRYSSGIKTGGDHRLTLSIAREDLRASSDPQLIKVNVQPPNPIFLDPPQQVLRIWSKPDEKNQTTFLTPKELPIRIMIEFPDGFQREISASRLYVDGMLMVENTAPPYDQFSWPLSTYESSGSHLLQVEVEDKLGLKQSTIETMAEVMVEPAKRTLMEEVVNKDRLIVLGAVIISALVLVAVFLFAGRQTVMDFIRKRRSHLDKDPLTQPVHIRPVGERVRSAGTHSPTVPRSSMTVQSAPARMVRLSEGGHPIPASAVLLNQRLFTFGSDPQQASCVLDSPTVEPLHCRLAHTFGGQFMIYDAGSVAGTWVNYTPVTSDGAPLQHGDTIHIGRVAFRFELSIPPAVQPPKVISA